MATTPAGQDKAREHSEGNAKDKAKSAFISYAFDDSDFATRLCDSLEDNGFSCWLAERDIPPGDLWAERIVEAIDCSKSLVLVASGAALGSVHVINEIHQAYKRAKPIYTILIPPAQIRGEMDLYLSRWNWLPGGGKSPEDIAAQIARALANPSEWLTVATLAPSLRRSVLYRPAAFARLVAALTVALLLVVTAGAFTLHRYLASSYEQIGYIAMSTSADSGPPVKVHPNVWLTAKGVSFRDARLIVSTDNGNKSEIYLNEWPVPEQVGSSEQVILAVGAEPRRLTTCLIVPNRVMGSLWRITQEFSLRPGADEVRVAEIAEPRAQREDGSPCIAKP